jgi:hypothetical protein
LDGQMDVVFGNGYKQSIKRKEGDCEVTKIRLQAP